MITTTPSTQYRSIRYRRLMIGVGALAGLVVLLAVLAVFWLPGYAKSQLEARLSSLLQRPVTVASVEIKLHTLELTISGFRIAEKTDTDTDAAQQSFFSFAKLHLDFSIESIRYFAPVIESATLIDPELRLLHATEDRFNFSDLLEKFAQPAVEEKTDQTAKFSIANITIRNGQFEFDDRFTQSAHRISEINLGIPAVANFGGASIPWIEPRFSAKINDAPFSLYGKLHIFAENQEAALVVKLDRIDVTRFNRHIALPKGIALLSGQLSGDLQLAFMQQSGQAPDIALTGNAAIHRLAIENNAVASPYQVNLQQLILTLPQIDLTGTKPSQIGLELNKLALTRIGEQEPVAALNKLAIDTIAINTVKRQFAIGEMTADRLRATLRRGADGNIDWLRLFDSTTPTASSDSTASAAKTESGTADSTSWITKISRIHLKSAALHYEDLTMKKTVPMAVDELDLTLTDIDPTGIEPLNMALQARINRKGTIKATGALAWNPLVADLTASLDTVDIVPLQGWTKDKLDASLASGDVSFNGQIKIHGEPVKVAVNGQGALANFNILDANNSQNLLRWKKLEINALRFVNEPLRIDIKTIGLHDYFARLAILPDGGLNLQQIARRNDVPDTSTGATQQPAKPKGELPVYIDKIVLQHGNINFRDRFIKPNYRANLTGLSGQIGPLNPGKSGAIDIVGALDKTAPLQIKGDIDPFGAELWLDIAVKVKGIDLPPLSPYSAKYIGYEIEKGKLSADVYYHVENGTLTADNKIFLDQFTLGNAVESENPTSLPLSLAISLLKNRRGEIDIRLPLQGSLDDPQFNLGDIVFTAFVNLISKAVTSPFALLGSVLEGGEELSEITFIPGFFNIEAESAERLHTLAKVLDDRPSLNLEVIGHYDQNLDRDGLKLAMLQNKVKTQKLIDDADQDIADGALEDITLSRKEYDQYLKIAYEKETFDKPRNMIGIAKNLPGDEMERLILANIAITDNDLKALAENRAIAARNWLIEHGEVPGERIFIVGVHEDKENDQKQGSRVEFLLR